MSRKIFEENIFATGQKMTVKFCLKNSFFWRIILRKTTKPSSRKYSGHSDVEKSQL